MKNKLPSFVISFLSLLTVWLLWDSQPGNPGPQPYFTSPEYGIHSGNWWHPAAIQGDINSVDELGFGWVKYLVPWKDIEKSKGGFDWYRLDKLILPYSEEKGLKVVARLDRQPDWTIGNIPPTAELTVVNTPPPNLQDYFDFCGEIATRYKGRIHAYQVWNEPNLAREWGGNLPDPAGYVEMLAGCYKRIKAADPDAIVISAGISPTCTNNQYAMDDLQFLQGMYDAGAADYFDVLGAHAPGFDSLPSDDPYTHAEEHGQPMMPDGKICTSYAFRHVERVRDLMVANGDGHRQIALMEMGWVTNGEANSGLNHEEVAAVDGYRWFMVSEEVQAERLTAAYQYAYDNWTPWLGLMSAIYLADVDWDPAEQEEWWWAINVAGYRRPAYQAIVDMDKPYIVPEGKEK